MIPKLFNKIEYMDDLHNTHRIQEPIDKELEDKVSYWILKAIIELGGHKTFIDEDNYFCNETMANFLGLGKYVDLEFDDFNRIEPLKILKKKLEKLKRKAPFSSSSLLNRNMDRLSNLIYLNSDERKILEFIILLKQYDMIDNAINFLGENIRVSRAKQILSHILNIPLERINEAFSARGTFNRSALLQFDTEDSYSFGSKLKLLNYEFPDKMLNLDEEIIEMIKDSVRISSKGLLEISDYDYISKDLDILMPYLNKAIEDKDVGVNILFYGLPGTGKTELSKTISEILGTDLYEISYSDNDDDPIEGTQRLRAYKTAQALLSSSQTLIMYDEAEDVFDSHEGGFFTVSQKQSDKAWINKVLETNIVPTIWITNHIESIDNAIVRRFDISIELPIPAKSKRAEIIRKYSENILDNKSIDKLSENENIAPALISTAVKVTSKIPTKDRAKALIQLINNTLKAQGYPEIKKGGELNLPNNYSVEFINTDTDIEKLTKGIQKHSSARLCLYGASGTGKSAFAKHIAQVLDKPFVIKSGSSLMSKWVGETEQNIAKAFKEASESKAVLIFDEIDGFLGKRESADASWQITQVNEMLVQMENFEGIFIATTNLIDHLDRASLRRFDLKLEFKALDSEQTLKIFLSYCKELELEEPNEELYERIKNIREATTGDFATVARQSRFREIKSVEEFIDRVKEEIAIKSLESGKVMGFSM